MAKFDNDFVIENSEITELSAQKKSFAGTDSVQIPFSVGVGPGHRSRGIPYFCTTSNPSSVFTTSKQTNSITVPIIYYTFEVQSDVYFYNQATNGVETLRGSVVANAAKSSTQYKRGSYSIKFDGTTDYLDMDAVSSTIQNMETGSITFWVYIDDYSTSNRVFFEARDLTDGADSQLEIYVSSALNKTGFLVKEGGSTVLDLSWSGKPNLGEWAHISITVGDNGTIFYLNGAVAASSTTQAFFNDVDSIDIVTLGAEYPPPGTEHKGYIDEFAIWDVELNSTIIAAIAASTPPDLNTVCGEVDPKYQPRTGILTYD